MAADSKTTSPAGLDKGKFYKNFWKIPKFFIKLGSDDQIKVEIDKA